MDVAGLVSGRGPELPSVTSIDQIELLTYFWSHFRTWLRAPIWETSIKSSSKDVSGLVFRVVFEPVSCFVHVSVPFSGVAFELGSELPFGTPVNRIELRR